MKIGIITRNLLDVGGGIENYLNSIFRVLATRHELRVLTQNFRNPEYQSPFPVGYPPLRSYAPFWVWAQMKKKALFAESDLIISGSTLTAPLVKNAPRKKVSFAYGLDIMHEGLLYQRMFPPALKSMDCVIACSQATSELCIQRGISPEKVQIAYPGVDHRRFHPDPDARRAIRRRWGIEDDAPVVFSISRHVKKKGVLRLVRDVVPKLIREVPNVRVLVGGRGPQTPEIERAVHDLGLTKNVLLVGYLSEEDLPRYYTTADVFSLPEEPVEGDFEGFGMVHLESSACGVPSVGSRMEAATEAIEPGVRGVACDPHNVDEHVNAIKKFLIDDEYRREFSLRCREVIVKKWSLEKTTEDAAKIIERAGESD